MKRAISGMCKSPSAKAKCFYHTASITNPSNDGWRNQIDMSLFALSIQPSIGYGSILLVEPRSPPSPLLHPRFHLRPQLDGYGTQARKYRGLGYLDLIIHMSQEGSETIRDARGGSEMIPPPCSPSHINHDFRCSAACRLPHCASRCRSVVRKPRRQEYKCTFAAVILAGERSGVTPPDRRRCGLRTP